MKDNKMQLIKTKFVLQYINHNEKKYIFTRAFPRSEMIFVSTGMFLGLTLIFYFFL